tara:strand:+ start:70 stop:579 length:510 start_codon:yes stop_codon:yes gene_type:complete
MNTDTPISTKCRVNSFITCDGVHIDPATGKHSLLGIFSSLRAKNFPVVHPKMTWFLSLSELRKGTHHLTISMADPTGELEPKIIIDRDFEAPDPLHRVNLINDIHRLKILESKNYSIVIEVDDEIVFVDTLPVIDQYRKLEQDLEKLIEEYDEDEDEDDDYYNNDDSVF